MLVSQLSACDNDTIANELKANKTDHKQNKLNQTHLSTLPSASYAALMSF